VRRQPAGARWERTYLRPPAFQQFARDPNTPVVQTADPMHDRLSLDRFHPGDEGYALIARRIADTF
jgi:lysophospholipase L1-like esterase